MNSRRIAREIKILTESDNLGKIFDFHANEDFSLDILVYGDTDSGCYSNVPFYFKLKFPENYPFVAPELKFVNCNRFRFHPNFYVCGRVCLTILGTWGDSDGRSYSPITTVESIIMSISSMIHGNPIIEEPGQRQHKESSSQAKHYHLAAKYASLDNSLRYITNGISLPSELKVKLREYLKEHQSVYLNTIKELEDFDSNHVSYFHGSVKIDTSHLKRQLSKVID